MRVLWPFSRVLFKGEVFTCLRELYIEDCPKLIGGLPVQLPSLTKLDICECKQLVASLPNSPALHQLLLSYTGKIEGGVYSILPFPPFASLSRLEIRECPPISAMPLQHFTLFFFFFFFFKNDICTQFLQYFYNKF